MIIFDFGNSPFKQNVIITKQLGKGQKLLVSFIMILKYITALSVGGFFIHLNRVFLGLCLLLQREKVRNLIVNYRVYVFFCIIGVITRFVMLIAWLIDVDCKSIIYRKVLALLLSLSLWCARLYWLLKGYGFYMLFFDIWLLLFIVLFDNFFFLFNNLFLRLIYHCKRIARL